MASTTFDFTWVYPTVVPRPTAAAASVAGAPTDAAASEATSTTADLATTAATPPLATELPDAEQAWLSLTPELDATWGVDTPLTIQMLDNFLTRFPDYAPASDKLYSALLAYGADLQQAGDPQAATEALLKAQALLPDRGEADAALLALTAPPPAPLASADTSDPESQIAAAGQPDQASPVPSDAVAAPDEVDTPAPPVQAAPLRVAAPTPAPQPPNSQVQRPAPTTRPAGNAVPVAPVVVRSAPQPAAPTPTKAPFVAPVQR
ncbi:MAG: hypothetical protein JO057_26475 [Chloroflexi bacterium]|nr:hypothetical protein [Chloroflexota bacterium]